MMKEYINFWKRSFDFHGRARRREYWVSYLWNLAILYVLIGFSMLGVFLGMDVNTGEITNGVFALGMIGLVISMIFSLIMFVPQIAICVRRCHDIGLSGWYYLLCVLGCFLCGIGSIAWIVITCMDSKPEENQWGPNPKDPMYNEYEGGASIGFAIGAFIISLVLYFGLVMAGGIFAALLSYY